MNNPFELLFKYRKIIWHVTLSDIKQKYAGSILGKMWILLYPLLFLSAYFLVYVSIFKIKLEGISTFDYVLIIFSGLIPWFGFAEAIGSSVNTVTSNGSLIKNTLFPIELIPFKSVLASIISQMVGLVLLLITLSIKQNLSAYVLLLPIVIILQILFTAGLSWMFASLNVFFRDLGQIINVLLILLMLVSPIAYTTEMISKDVLVFMQFNPLYYMIIIYRDILFYNTLPPMHVMTIFTGFSSVLFIFGYFIFTRLKVVFSDYV